MECFSRLTVLVFVVHGLGVFSFSVLDFRMGYSLSYTSIVIGRIPTKWSFRTRFCFLRSSLSDALAFSFAEFASWVAVHAPYLSLNRESQPLLRIRGITVWPSRVVQKVLFRYGCSSSMVGSAFKELTWPERVRFSVAGPLYGELIWPGGSYSVCGRSTLWSFDFLWMVC
jgi:hypothetical protein